MTKTKTKWLNGIKNGTGADAPTWRGLTDRPTGDLLTKRELLANIKKQLGLHPNRSFAAAKAVK